MKKTINVSEEVYELTRTVQRKLIDTTRGPRGGNPAFISLEATVYKALVDLDKELSR